MSPLDSSTRVVFFQVKSAAEKPSTLIRIVQHHFFRKEPILILTEEDKALQYVDELLWKTPPESFLPHSIITEPSQERIAITKIKKNLNEAHCVFNLCSTPLLIEGSFRTIYDFEDLGSPNKKNLSQIRYNAYKKAHYLIESHLPG